MNVLKPPELGKLMGGFSLFYGMTEWPQPRLQMQSYWSTIRKLSYGITSLLIGGTVCRPPVRNLLYCSFIVAYTL
ncbi:hypothetical protein [Bacillus sp. FSL K6-3431]|uniref:hypothetical protein n=1 Tax=Bacillus sp. FSL K6-3431 TaxID=2921500 RepID=UPI0030F5C25D